MTVKVVGTYPKLERVVTGLHSFDLAVGNPYNNEVGLPLRSIIELHGFPFCGKSTFSYFLAAAINKTGTVVPVDFDGFEIEYLKRVMEGVGFEGTLHLITEYKDDKPRSDADMLMEMVGMLRNKETSAGIFDSVSTYQSIAEGEGDIGEAFMGKRAREIGQFCRRALTYLRDPAVSPKAVFVVNHAYARLGGHGFATAGGRVLEASKQVSVSMFRGDQFDPKSERDDFIVEGRVTKLRYGGIGRKFKLACILGRGIHIGMTALLDCVDLEIAERGQTVKIGKTSVGRLKTLVEAAANDDDKKFAPFIEALAAHKPRKERTDED